MTRIDNHTKARRIYIPAEIAGNKDFPLRDDDDLEIFIQGNAVVIMMKGEKFMVDIKPPKKEIIPPAPINYNPKYGVIERD